MLKKKTKHERMFKADKLSKCSVLPGCRKVKKFSANNAKRPVFGWEIRKNMKEGTHLRLNRIRPGRFIDDASGSKEGRSLVIIRVWSEV